MQKADIAAQIHQQAGIPKEEATRLLDWILELVKTTLQAGESVMIAGFGKFTVRSKRARKGRNPRTGETTTILARRVVTFQASHLFKASINSPSKDVQEDVA